VYRLQRELKNLKDALKGRDEVAYKRADIVPPEMSGTGKSKGSRKQ
jgi:hypothetical protein